jgi:ribosomal protein L40E
MNETEDVCQYCGADLEAHRPALEQGYLYGVECSRCPSDRRNSHYLARQNRVSELICPDCGAAISPADSHPDVLVVKEVTYEVCPECGARCGVAEVTKIRDVSGGTM